jgi:hypothetical protein
MLWESSKRTYADVDMAINSANVTWARVWEDIRRLEEMAKAEQVDIYQLCDHVFLKTLSETHLTAMPQAWKMTVSFETPYQHDDEVDQDEKKDDESGAQPGGDDDSSAHGSSPQGGMYLVLMVPSLVHMD